ncbi:GNAT family N-acetyltransferase [Metabacillus bambusae]|uniref:GNAT family N-acetyltransferase n=1 Tax=Metabacillus bambusae TaxID=2795218 RepID=A0ABS3MXL9_9BACI|nr:GNAT family N-acetyltransferase [Metabacillus bambusae]MBO1510753.1 GNAT family N-acetyltransferase [Metabacillus bambusae]
MEHLQFVKNYQEDERLRSSFNKLAQSTFGINFELWFEKGYWTDRYQPYSFIDGEKVIANVSVNKLDLIINGETKRAIQIGTVMTHPDYRGKGLSKRLMNKVLSDYENIVDVIYLFANSSVLDYYPKFGFKEVGEHLFSKEFAISRETNTSVIKLDGSHSDDLAFIYELAKERLPVSQQVSTVNTAELVMFYSLYVFPQNIVYLEEEKVIVIYQQKGENLHLYDVISSININLHSIIKKIASERNTKVIFHFTPNLSEDVGSKPYKGEEILFVKSKAGLEFPKQFKYPMTSKA